MVSNLSDIIPGIGHGDITRSTLSQITHGKVVVLVGGLGWRGVGSVGGGGP